MPDTTRALSDLKIDREHGPLEMAVLRVREPPADLPQRLGQAFGLAWPPAPAKGASGIYCTGPNEWLVTGREREDVARRAAEGCGDLLHHLPHVGAGQRLWRISGVRAPDLLARGAALDFHPKAFVAGHVAQTLFAQVFALIVRPNEDLSYELVTEASYAHHLTLWFERAARDV
jgi:sarcosine oxidase subunit gamma